MTDGDVSNLDTPEDGNLVDEIDATEPTNLDAADRRLSDEAARWRRQARAEEAQRIVAEARVAEQNRLRAEDILSKKLADPTDAWVFGADLADLLNDVGLVDDSKVLTFAEELVGRKPHLAAKLGPVGAPSAAVTGDGKYDVKGNQQPTWTDILRGQAG